MKPQEYELHDSVDDEDAEESADEHGIKSVSGSSLTPLDSSQTEVVIEANSIDDRSRLWLSLSESSVCDCSKSFSLRFRVRMTSRLIDTGLRNIGFYSVFVSIDAKEGNIWLIIDLIDWLFIGFGFSKTFH